MISYVNDPAVYVVVGDSENGGYIAARHLLHMGFRRLGNLNGEPGNIPGDLRREGYLRAIAESGVQENPAFQFRLREGGEAHDFASGYEIGTKITTMAERPDALFAYNDLSALGAMQALLEHGVHIPDDIALVGFDDIERSQYAPVPLTTVRQPTQAIGAKAMELLIRRIEGKEVNVRTVLETELVIRASSGSGRRQTGPVASSQ
jgi:DNA-binding LacI/PurR family transcriptional regulator